MEIHDKTRVSRFINVLAVKSEPGLTHAQLMLTNYDLKPGRSILICYLLTSECHDDSGT